MLLALCSNFVACTCAVGCPSFDNDEKAHLLVFTTSTSICRVADLILEKSSSLRAVGVFTSKQLLKLAVASEMPGQEFPVEKRTMQQCQDIPLFSIFLSLLSNGLLGGGGGQSMSSPGDIGGGNGTGTPTGGGGKGTGHLKLLHGGHTALRHGRRIIHEGNTGSGGGTGGTVAMLLQHHP
ncbi:hypothetical protein CK203_077368 [Vitis vinifera]|uniref:Uncharacterized protein n=1 Tax=Vitis vinifera TaxID=29760 RepID=A0A438EY08_VITVI|nr:hypothetical protein CK203_077368 [Vitis vinifera]